MTELEEILTKLYENGQKNNEKTGAIGYATGQIAELLDATLGENEPFYGSKLNSKKDNSLSNRRVSKEPNLKAIERNVAKAQIKTDFLGYQHCASCGKALTEVEDAITGKKNGHSFICECMPDMRIAVG